MKLEECWDFFSSPQNLKLLTPEYLRFEMCDTQESCKMYPGQIITYTIRPLGFSMGWVTEITHVQQPDYFIDEQRFGPYTFWHHEHRFYPCSGGVEMVDTIYYKLPFGFLGKALHYLKVKKDLKAIFSYRSAKLDEMFGTFKST